MTDATEVVGKEPPARLSLPCTVCGEPMPFVRWLTRTGKNGKPATWPEYSKCQNPECSVGRRNTGLAPSKETERFFAMDRGHYEPDHPKAPGWRGKLCQYPSMDTLEGYMAVFSIIPGKILVSEADHEVWGKPESVTVRGKRVGLEVAPGITPGYRYFVIPIVDGPDEFTEEVSDGTPS